MSTEQIWQTESESSSATENLAKKLGSNCQGGEVFNLVSDLGGGKTTFVRGLARGLGSQDHVSSPTFKISNFYQGKKLALYHYDFYRLQDDQLIAHELADALAGHDVVIAIEWGSQVSSAVPSSAVTVQINSTGSNKRKISISGHKKYLIKDIQ